MKSNTSIRQFVAEAIGVQRTTTKREGHTTDVKVYFEYNLHGDAIFTAVSISNSITTSSKFQSWQDTVAELIGTILSWGWKSNDSVEVLTNIQIPDLPEGFYSIDELKSTLLSGAFG